MPNRLAGEKSPYLLQHAANPVDWYPWGEEAFARARAEDKPIFLSIGYSTCHWCHVMAHESFENTEVAAVLNAHFVAIKVDREERPDVDHVYMTFVQSVTGGGGWPLSAWLTPELKPFFGGTYYPPTDRGGRPGFVTLLNAVAKAWREQRGQITEEAARLFESLQRLAAPAGPREGTVEGAPISLADAAGDVFEKAFQYFSESFDAVHGGFGGAPKFPRPAVLNFLHRVAALQGGESPLGAEAVKMGAFTLQKMAEGGVHDHVGGGYHRYAVDGEWFVPHFEKMLYDQAQLATACLAAKQATGREVYAWLARDIFAYVRRDLTAPGGGFYSAEDADSEVPETEVGRGVPAEPLPEAGDGSAGGSPASGGAKGDQGFALPAEKPQHAEGAFYVWTQAELERVLGGDAAFFCTHFGIEAGGNVAADPHAEFTGKNILSQRQSLVATARAHGVELAAAETKLLTGLEKLRVVRAQRPRPLLDDKIITAWNGLMISALARAHQVLGDAVDEGRDGPPGRPLETVRPAVTPYLEAAIRAAEFLHRELYDAERGVLYRSWRAPAAGLDASGRGAAEGFAEDYAALIQGLLDLYEASFEIRWLRWAAELQAQMDARFWDAAGGGYFNSRADDTSIIVRLKENYDGAEPAPGSLAVLNLLRLDWMLGDGGGVPSPRGIGASPDDGTRSTGLSYRERALQTIESLRPQWNTLPHALPQLLCAFELALSAPRTVVLAGDPGAADFRALAAVLHEHAGPWRALLCADGADGQRWLAQRMPYLAEMKPDGGHATAYVCEEFSCQQPVSTPADLRQLLAGA